MGSESTINLTEGDGSVILHAWQRTVGSTAKQQQIMLPGDGWRATYTAIARGVRVNTANSHPLFIQADGTDYVALTRLTIRQANIFSAASTLDMRVLRVTSAGGGGSSISARSFDASDTTPFGGTIQSLPSHKGTESDELLSIRLGVTNANPITSVNHYEWRAGENGEKAILFGQATSSGIAVKNIGTGTEVDIEAQFHLVTEL